MLTYKHHIIPKHAGGTNSSINLIELTIEDHAEAHRILFEENGQWQDFIAWKTLSGQIRGKDIRREISRLSFLGKKHTEETKQKIRLARANQICTEETRKKMSQKRKGVPLTWETNATTPEANAKRSLSMKKHIWETYTCPHCQKIGKSNAMKRWHFDNCKERKCS